MWPVARIGSGWGNSMGTEIPEISRFLGVRGEFPKRALRAVLEWSDLHQAELMQDWVLASERKSLQLIDPLESIMKPIIHTVSVKPLPWYRLPTFPRRAGCSRGGGPDCNLADAGAIRTLQAFGARTGFRPSPG